jgi:spore germination cell wall hydrolase CwlJ-like protein
MKTTPAAAAAWDLPRAPSFGILICFAFAAAVVALTPFTRLREFREPSAPAPAVNTDTNLAPAPPFYLHAATAAESQRAVRCLTDAVYYEAANEPLEGQRAIAQVIVNRVRDPHFPKSVCGVVYEGWQRRTGCQFSFVCDGSLHRRRAVPSIWEGLVPVAQAALNGYVVPEVGSATHYYAQYVRPNWEGTVDKIAQIGQHIFCSWQGRAGYVSALDASYQGGEFDISNAVLEGDLVRPAATPVSKREPTKTLARRRIHRVTGRLRVAEREDRGHGRA